MFDDFDATTNEQPQPEVGNTGSPGRGNPSVGLARSDETSAEGCWRRRRRGGQLGKTGIKLQDRMRVAWLVNG